MLSKLLTFEKDLVIVHPDPTTLVKKLRAQTSDEKTKTALTCVLDFFKDDADAMMSGRYRVIVKRNLIKGCTYELFYSPLALTPV